MVIRVILLSAVRPVPISICHLICTMTSRLPKLIAFDIESVQPYTCPTARTDIAPALATRCCPPCPSIPPARADWISCSSGICGSTRMLRVCASTPFNTRNG